MTERSIVVVTAGLSQPSATRLLADRLVSAIERALGEAGVAPRVEVIELRDHAQDLTNNLLTGFPSPTLRSAIDAVVAADGLIAVSPIFSASYSGLFKMFFDVLQPEALAGKPTLIAATAGTARHSLALEHAMRPLFAYLRTVVVPTAVFAATEDFGSDGALQKRVERAAGELADVMVSARSSRLGRTRLAPEVVPFAELLRAQRVRG
jgi:FMN reductase